MKPDARLLAFCMMNFGFSAFWAFEGVSLPVMLYRRMGFATGVGLFFALAGAVGLVAPIASGWARDRLGKETLLFGIGAALFALSLFAIPFMAGPSVIFLAISLYFGINTCYLIHQTLLRETFRDMWGRAVAIINISGSFGSFSFLVWSLLTKSYSLDPIFVAAIEAFACWLFARFIPGQAGAVSERRAPMGKNLFVLAVAVFAMWTGNHMVVKFLPVYASEVLGLTREKISLVIIGAGVLMVLANLIFGKLTDLGHPKEVALTGISLFSAGIIIGTLARALAVKIGAFVLGMGVGFAGMAIGSATLTYAVLPEGREGVGMGVFLLAGNLAVLVGPLLAGVIIDKVGFAASFLVGSFFLLASALLIALKVQHRQSC